jgi:hypothetical protein
VCEVPVQCGGDPRTAEFGAYLPEWSPSGWVKGRRYEFVSGMDEIDELERLLGGATGGKA